MLGKVLFIMLGFLFFEKPHGKWQVLTPEDNVVNCDVALAGRVDCGGDNNHLMMMMMTSFL